METRWLMGFEHIDKMMLFSQNQFLFFFSEVKSDETTKENKKVFSPPK